MSFVFIKASEKLLINYVYPEIHPHNCVSSVLNYSYNLFLQKQPMYNYLKYAISDLCVRGIITDVIIELLKQVTGYQDIFLKNGYFFKVDPHERNLMNMCLHFQILINLF